MNIMQVQDDLKNFSQEQLIKEIQRPSGMAPQFLVLSEINRRQRVKQDVNARMAQQQPTVAEEAIASAGVPQGGLADMSQALAPKSASALSTGVGTSMPMAMQTGGFLKTPDEIDEELEMMTDPDSMDFSRMSLEEMAEFAKKMKGLSQPNTMYGGGLTYMQEGGTLGLRQNNPGNIRPGAGFIGETGVGSGYATFQNPLFGGRALARLLSTYKNQYGISNVDSLIDRYAPSGDNTMESRANYKGFIANKLGVGKDDEIDLDDDNTKLGVMKAIVEFENRNQNPYSDQEYNLMIQSAKMDDEDKVSDLLTNTNSARAVKNNVSPIDKDVMDALSQSQTTDNQGSGLGLVSQAFASGNKTNSMAGEFGPAGLDRPDFILPRFMQGPRSLQDGEIGFEAAYGAGLRPFDESDEVMGSQIPRMPGKEGAATYQDLLNLEEASRAQAGFIDPEKAFGSASTNFFERLSGEKKTSDVDTGEGAIVTKDGKDFVRTKVTEKDDSGKDKVVTKDIELNKDGTIKDDGKTTTIKPSDIFGPAPTGTIFQRSNLEQDIIDLQEQLKKDREVDKWLGIAKTGLALADPTKTISEATEKGIDAMSAARKRYTDGVIDLINARSKLAKSTTGLKLSDLFTNLSRNRTSQTKYSEMGAEPNPELLQRLQDEEREILNLISRYPGYEQFATGISVPNLKEKKDEKAT